MTELYHALSIVTQYAELEQFNGTVVGQRVVLR